MKNILSILKRKQKGESSLITSAFVIWALGVFIFIYIGTIGDTHARIVLDQIARQNILLLETGSEYNIYNSITDDIKSIKQGQTATNINVKVTVSGKTGTSTYTNPTSRPKASYGDKIKLTITCTIKTTGWTSSGYLGKTKNTNYKVVKQSTAKY